MKMLSKTKVDSTFRPCFANRIALNHLNKPENNYTGDNSVARQRQHCYRKNEYRPQAVSVGAGNVRRTRRFPAAPQAYCRFAWQRPENRARHAYRWSQHSAPRSEERGVGKECVS